MTFQSILNNSSVQVGLVVISTLLLISLFNKHKHNIRDKLSEYGLTFDQIEVINVGTESGNSSVQVDGEGQQAVGSLVVPVPQYPNLSGGSVSGESLNVNVYAKGPESSFSREELFAKNLACVSDENLPPSQFLVSGNMNEQDLNKLFGPNTNFSPNMLVPQNIISEDNVPLTLTEGENLTFDFALPGISDAAMPKRFFYRDPRGPIPVPKTNIGLWNQGTIPFDTHADRMVFTSNRNYDA